MTSECFVVFCSLMIWKLKHFNDPFWATEQTCGPEHWAVPEFAAPLSEFGAADAAADCRSSWAQWKTKVSGDNDPTTPRNNNKLLCQLSAKQHARRADHQTDLAQGQRGRCVPCWQITTGNCATASPADLTEGDKLLLTFLLHWMVSLCLLLIRYGEV